MQDRFKCRFWHKPTNKMLYCYGYNEHFVFGDTMDGIYTEYNPANFDDCILMQCTGLKDKTGKLIFEGDIIADINSGCVATIEYLSSSYSLMAHIRRMDDFIPIEEICYTEIEGTPFEIIGNIYENPELLEESQC